MEFGLFLQGYVPGPDAHDPDAEHEAFMREVELVELADKTNWKYAWFSEHHALTEYSHLSSSEVMMGYLARATERIHLGSGIFNLARGQPPGPQRRARRDARPLSEWSLRVRHRSGRRLARSRHFQHPRHDVHQERVGRGHREIPEDVGDRGLHVPGRALPARQAPQHPAEALQRGAPADLGRVRQPAHVREGRRLGIGALGFNFSPIHEMRPMIDTYKNGIGECTEPIGRYVNDNVMLTNAVLCFEDGKRPARSATQPNRGYLYSLVCLYHDTIPKPDWAPVWPEPPIRVEPEIVRPLSRPATLLCGTPEEVCEQLRHYEGTGVDQLSFGVPNDLETRRSHGVHRAVRHQGHPRVRPDPVHSHHPLPRHRPALARRALVEVGARLETVPTGSTARRP